MNNLRLTLDLPGGEPCDLHTRDLTLRLFPKQNFLEWICPSFKRQESGAVSPHWKCDEPLLAPIPPEEDELIRNNLFYHNVFVATKHAVFYLVDSTFLLFSVFFYTWENDISLGC